MLEHHGAKTTFVVVCTMKHPPTVEVNVYGESAGTGDQ
jgi:hypothetical protein